TASVIQISVVIVRVCRPDFSDASEASAHACPRYMNAPQREYAGAAPPASLLQNESRRPKSAAQALADGSRQGFQSHGGGFDSRQARHYLTENDHDLNALGRRLPRFVWFSHSTNGANNENLSENQDHEFGR